MIKFEFEGRAKENAIGMIVGAMAGVGAEAAGFAYMRPETIIGKVAVVGVATAVECVVESAVTKGLIKLDEKKHGKKEHVCKDYVAVNF